VKVLRQAWSTLRVLRKARRNRLDFVRAMLRRPQLLVGTGLYELAVLGSARVPARLKILAELKSASVVACAYCLDIGSALARGEGITEAQVRDLHRHRSSEAFDEDERLVLDLAEALSRAPVVVDDDLRRRLDATFRPAQQVELAAIIAWENQRARLNQALGIPPSGFSDGQLCALAQPVRQ
jgi:AhpD family alkylhydroperoxidase